MSLPTVITSKISAANDVSVCPVAKTIFRHVFPLALRTRAYCDYYTRVIGLTIARVDSDDDEHRSDARARTMGTSLIIALYFTRSAKPSNEFC